MITNRPKREKPRCGARTRKGTPCQRRLLLRGGKCPNQGGMSTGPRTEEGKRRAAENLRKWREERSVVA